MKGVEREKPSGPLVGRLILLLAAYAPIAVIAGLRAMPAAGGWVAALVGVLGIAIWACFLNWLPRRQPRESVVEWSEFIDSEVTGYIVSLLLPVIAVSRPDLHDWLAYGVCAALILVVAFAAQLWSVNPITYLCGMRAARAVVDGEPLIVLVRGPLGGSDRKTITRRLGVTLVLGDSS